MKSDRLLPLSSAADALIINCAMANIKFALAWGGWRAAGDELEAAEGHAAPAAQQGDTMGLLHPRAAILLQLLVYAMWTYR